jgi:hypothetical protein
MLLHSCELWDPQGIHSWVCPLARGLSPSVGAKHPEEVRPMSLLGLIALKIDFQLLQTFIEP